MRPRILLVASIALLVAGPFVVAEAPQDDGGLGVDASDAKATATPLPGYGAYRGELRSQDDDWFTVLDAPAAPACVRMDVTGDTDADATLALRSGSREVSLRAPIPATGSTTLALAGSQVSQTWEGFQRLANPAGNDAARPRHYSFTLSASGAPSADGGVASDAGAMFAQAVPLPAGCSGGRLQPLNGLGDTVDTYSFTLAAPTTVVYGLGASAPVSLQLYDASGAAVGAPLPPDGAVATPLPSGTFYLQTSTMQGASVIEYVVSLLGPEPPGGPCRPYCVVAMASAT